MKRSRSNAHAVLSSDSQRDRGSEIPLQALIAQGRRRAMPSDGIERIAVPDQVAAARHHRLRAPHLRRVRLLIQLHQEHADRNASSKR